MKEDCTPPHVTSTYINGIKLKLQLKKGESLENNKKNSSFFDVVVKASLSRIIHVIFSKFKITDKERFI